jgi:diadenosine tetraphosphate (Ap4A) HIT family hydrolase
MSSIFSRIINGEIPGRFVWREDDVVAFLSAGPLADGHTLVVPTEEVDRWTDASPELLARVMKVAQKIGAAQVEVFGSARAGLLVAGYEVHHLHVHVWPSNSMADYDFGSVDQNPDPAQMDANAEKLRAGLRSAGHGEHVPDV